MRIEVQPHTQEWHAIRQKYVGGSEIAALFDDSPYLTRLELWLTKRGEVSGDIPDNERMFWGRLLEDAIGQGVALRKGWAVENPGGYYTCDDTPGMGCTPDRLIMSAPGRDGLGALQIKVVDRFQFKDWEHGQPPMTFLLQ